MYNKIIRSIWRFVCTKVFIMGVIRSAIINGTENVYHKKLQEGTWRKFDKILKAKKLVVFGAGKACEQFLNCYGSKYKPDAVIDNDEQKWGCKIQNVTICSPEILHMYKPEEVIILISCTKCIDEFTKQLDELGYNSYFSYYSMETKRLNVKIGRFLIVVNKKFKDKEEAILFHIFRVFPVKKNKIIFLRHSGEGFGCHEKYIALKLIEEKLNCKMIWLVNDTSEVFPKEITKVKNTKWNRIYQLSTAGIWLDNDVKSKDTFKRKSQFYVNTWHGTGISLKKFYLDAPNTIGTNVIDSVKRDAEIADVYLAGSENIAKIYKSAFGYKGNTYISGSPRVDILLHKDNSLELNIRKRLDLRNNEKLFLYAPTFRRNANTKSFSYNMSLYSLNTEKISEALSKKFGGSWRGAIRLHPRMANIGKLFKANNMLDISTYPDVQEILLVTDVLITDYSSIMFDMGYTLKPVFLYALDISEYIENERDFYINIQELPFKLSKDEKELIEAINNFDEKNYKDNLIRFNEGFGILEDGKASERVAEIIRKRLINKS